MDRSLALFAIGLVFGGGIGFAIAASNGVTFDGHDHGDPAAHGGGLGDAFGGAGQQTFGVGASGITKFTSYVAAVFLLCAVMITVLSKRQAGSILDDTGILPTNAPGALGAGPNNVAPPASGTGAPAGGGSAPVNSDG